MMIDGIDALAVIDANVLLDLSIIAFVLSNNVFLYERHSSFNDLSTKFILYNNYGSYPKDFYCAPSHRIAPVVYRLGSYRDCKARLFAKLAAKYDSHGGSSEPIPVDMICTYGEPGSRSTYVLCRQNWPMTHIYLKLSSHRVMWTDLSAPTRTNQSSHFCFCEGTHQEGPAQAHIQVLNLIEGMCAPSTAWLAWCEVFRIGFETMSRHSFLVVSRFGCCLQILSKDFSS